MDTVLALAVGVLFAAGTKAMLKRDLFRVVLGVTLVSYAVNLFVLAAGLSRGRAPIHPVAAPAPVSDPLVQALVLTAVVISAGTTAVMIGLVYRAHVAFGTLDQSVVSGATEDDRGGGG